MLANLHYWFWHRAFDLTSLLIWLLDRGPGYPHTDRWYWRLCLQSAAESYLAPQERREMRDATTT